MNEEDRRVVSTMVRYGGDFTQALGKAAYMADEENLRRIKETWPDYWEKYLQLSKIKPE